MLPSFVDLTDDARGGAVPGDGVGLGEHRRHLISAPVAGSDVGQTHEVGGDAWPEPDLTAQSRRLLQVGARLIEVAGAMFGNPKVPQGVGQAQPISCHGRECAGSLERRNRGCIVAPYDLVKRADPELCLSLTPDVTDVPVQLDRPPEQDQLVGDVRAKLQPSRRRIHKPSVQDPAARQSQIGLDRAKVTLGLSKSAGVTTKDRTLVQPSCLLKTGRPPSLPSAG
jgi:hypothetical protein